MLSPNANNINKQHIVLLIMVHKKNKWPFKLFYDGDVTPADCSKGEPQPSFLTHTAQQREAQFSLTVLTSKLLDVTV